MAFKYNEKASTGRLAFEQFKIDLFNGWISLISIWTAASAVLEIRGRTRIVFWERLRVVVTFHQKFILACLSPDGKFRGAVFMSPLLSQKERRRSDRTESINGRRLRIPRDSIDLKPSFCPVNRFQTTLSLTAAWKLLLVTSSPKASDQTSHTTKGINIAEGQLTSFIIRCHPAIVRNLFSSRWRISSLGRDILGTPCRCWAILATFLKFRQTSCVWSMVTSIRSSRAWSAQSTSKIIWGFLPECMLCTWMGEVPDRVRRSKMWMHPDVEMQRAYHPPKRDLNYAVHEFRDEETSSHHDTTAQNITKGIFREGANEKSNLLFLKAKRTSNLYTHRKLMRLSPSTSHWYIPQPGFVSPQPNRSHIRSDYGTRCCRRPRRPSTSQSSKPENTPAKRALITVVS